MPYNIASVISQFLRRDCNKGFVQVTRNKVNRGPGYGLEVPCTVPCTYRLYQFVHYKEVPLYTCMYLNEILYFQIPQHQTTTQLEKMMVSSSIIPITSSYAEVVNNSCQKSADRKGEKERKQLSLKKAPSLSVNHPQICYLIPNTSKYFSTEQSVHNLLL